MKTYSDVRRKPRLQTVNDLPDMCVQSDVHRTEIKHILAKYQQVGIVEHLREVDLVFRDVSEFSDFADMMRQAKVAEAEFMKLHPKLRQVFDNDVMVWLDAAHDPKMIEERRSQLEKLGVLKPLTPPEPVQPLS